MNMNNMVTINNIKVELNGEKNLLELIRKANINIPTFCYHSDLSAYGACRMCVVEIDGKGLQGSCSTVPKPGMKIKTHTNEIRNIRKMAVELLLANHNRECTTCQKSDSCGLRKISSQLGIDKVRFNTPKFKEDKDLSSYSLVRDHSKCILCGDCVRYCKEIQGIGALEFSSRGAGAKVTTAFNQNISDVGCVNCGGCVSVCPTGALVSSSQSNSVWDEINDDNKTVVVQIAPATRVAISEMFNGRPGKIATGKFVAALRMLGFDMVFDTAAAADLTTIEESNEFLKRKQSGENLPIFTSCCPSWVKFAEQYHPSLLKNLSSCKSPQQMFGSLLKKQIAEAKSIKRENLVVVSIMPCISKKSEAKREEFFKDGNPDVDYVVTTQEVGDMIKEVGIDFESLKHSSMDMPYGIASGSGILFGSTGGVSESVVRYAAAKLNKPIDNINFSKLRELDGIREAKVDFGDGVQVKIAIAHGLKNASKLATAIENKELSYDIVEVMACPSGCIGGAGQPVLEKSEKISERRKSIYKIDAETPIFSADQNFALEKELSKIIDSDALHDLFHTSYKKEKRFINELPCNLKK